MTLEVSINERNKDPQIETVTVDLDAEPIIKTRSYARAGNEKEKFFGMKGYLILLLFSF